MVGVDLDGDESGLVARLERAMLNSWPALSLAFDRDWVIRMADGYTKRSNSVTCLGADDTDLDARIERVVDIYRKRGLPAVFRLSPLAPPALGERLNERGWRQFDETIVMTLDLTDLADPDAGRESGQECRIETAPDSAWLEGLRQIDGMGRKAGAELERLLDVMMPACGYGRIVDRGKIAALALMVVDVEFAGLFEMMTAPERRRRGLAGRLVADLLRWCEVRGARTGWLAVVADNLPAVGLYRSLGFREVYRYHYRSTG